MSVTPNWSAIREQFPLLHQPVHGVEVAYFDNAATSQKPQPVLDVIDTYWTSQNANIHRGVHALSQIATTEFEKAREKVRKLINAPSAREVIFTKGCTESINLVAEGLTSHSAANATGGSSEPWIGEGGEILVSRMEHHSNIVPWQMAAERVGATVRDIPVTDGGEIDMDAYRRLLSSGKVKLVGIVHVSNAIGTVNPVTEIAKLAHEAGALVLVDGAQAGPHLRIDVQAIDADFYTLSCHKIYAPTGVGVLYGKAGLLEAMPAYQGGGDMIRTVSFEKGTTYAPLPSKFEAGTPNMAGVIGLGAAIDYLESFAGGLDESFEAIHKRELELADHGRELLNQIPGVKIFGPVGTAILSFVIDAAHAHDVGTILDMEGVAVRTGHHCCMPLMERLGVPATTRASVSFYNTHEEIERLAEGVRKVRRTFGA